jgi:hypothetical protein
MGSDPDRPWGPEELVDLEVGKTARVTLRLQ